MAIKKQKTVKQIKAEPEQEALSSTLWSARAAWLFSEFKRMCPLQTKPATIDSIEKARFFIMKGYEDISLLQAAIDDGYKLEQQDVYFPFPSKHQ